MWNKDSVGFGNQPLSRSGPAVALPCLGIGAGALKAVPALPDASCVNGRHSQTWITLNQDSQTERAKAPAGLR